MSGEAGTQPLLQVQNLQVHYPIGGGLLRRSRELLKAVDGVSFDIGVGETLGLVGESGCGKSTLGRSILRLGKTAGGSIIFNGSDISGFSQRKMRALRRQMQIVFQDPMESLNSRHSVGAIIEEPLIIHRCGNAAERRATVLQLLDRVGLPASAMERYPHEFSGGQRQRIGIARAIALKPSLLVCDEAVSALDVSVQAQILNLLLDLQQDMGLTMLFISHDLSVVRHMSDRIAVMKEGKLVECGHADIICGLPQHPYTRKLLAAIPGNAA